MGLKGLMNHPSIEIRMKVGELMQREGFGRNYRGNRQLNNRENMIYKLHFSINI